MKQANIGRTERGNTTPRRRRRAPAGALRRRCVMSLLGLMSMFALAGEASGWSKASALTELLPMPLSAMQRKATSITHGRLSRAECTAAASFILDSAQARDQGLAVDSFMTRLHADMLSLASQPPGERWFLHGADEALLLYRAATDIYRRPRDAGTHQRDFLRRCENYRLSRPASGFMPR